MIRITIAASAFALLAFAAAPQAEARGCIKGAVVGGVAGHVAGHHGLLGAAAGCAVGHHMANRDDAQRQNANDPNMGGSPQR